MRSGNVNARYGKAPALLRNDSVPTLLLCQVEQKGRLVSWPLPGSRFRQVCKGLR